MKIMIIGGSGYVGNSLIENLKGKHEIIATARNIRNVHHQDVTKIPVDIMDLKRLETVIAEHQPDVVIHAASMPKRDKGADEDLFLKTNVEGTLNVAKAVTANSKAQLLFISSGCAFKQIPGEAINLDSERENGTPFARSKNLAEEVLLAHYTRYPDSRLHIVYPSIILHPSQEKGVVPYAYAEAKEKGTITNKVPDGHINIIPHEKFAELIEGIIESPSLGQINRLQVAGIRQSSRELFERLQSQFEQRGIKSKVIEDADPAIETMCAMDERWLGKTLPNFNWGSAESTVRAILDARDIPKRASREV